MGVAGEKGIGCESRTITVAVCIKEFVFLAKAGHWETEKANTKALGLSYVIRVRRPALCYFVCKITVMLRPFTQAHRKSQLWHIICRGFFCFSRLSEVNF